MKGKLTRTPIKLQCPNCKYHPIPSKDINIHSLLAVCSKCACVFPFKASLLEDYSLALRPKNKPKGVNIQKEGANLLLTYRWWSGRFFLLLILAGLWNISTIFWLTITIASGASFMAMLGIVYAFGGINLLYISIAGFLNSTYIKIDKFQLSVTHQPIPWSLNPKLRRDNISQLYCTIHINQGKHYTRYSFDLNVLLKKGGTVCILRGIEKVEQARYLERYIEHFLGIEDRYVEGEYLK